MTPDEYLVAIAKAITRAEDDLSRDLRPRLLELALRLRALLATLGPSTSPTVRAFLYAQLRTQILELLQRLLVNPYYASLRTSLLALEPRLLPLAEKLLRLPKGTLSPSELEQLLRTTTVLSRPTAVLLAPGATGISPLTLQLERLLNTTVQSAFMRELPTPQLLDAVLPQRLLRTSSVPKGTAANAMYERLQATGAAVLWSLNTNTVQRASAEARLNDLAPTGWRWNAILDPRTCPICRPLHNTFAPEITDFPYGPPALHPRCRCVVIPEFPL